MLPTQPVLAGARPRASTARRIACIAASVITVVTSAAPDARANDGAVDHTFGTDGAVSLDLPGADWPTAMVRTATGGLAVAITSEHGVWIAVLTAEGRLVPTFAHGGIKHLRLADETIVVGLASTRDGGLLVAAWLGDETGTPLGDQRFVIARLLADGRLDTRYGTGGLAATAVGELAPLDLRVDRFAATPDGGAVVVGTTGAGSYFGGAGVAVLQRFTPTGEQDAQFGVNGIAPIASDAVLPVFAGLAIAPDGGILLSETNHTAGPFRYEALVRRFTPNGSPDLGWGTAGIAHLPIAGDWKFISDLAVDERGRIVCVGFAGSGPTGAVTSRLGHSGPVGPDDGFSPVVVRLHPDGRPDSSYGAGGVASFNRDGHGSPLGWSGDLAVTRAGAYLTAYEERGTQLRTQLLRITDRGGVDPTYGAGRAVRLPMQNTFAVVVLADRVVVAGERAWQTGGTVLASHRR